MGSFSRPKKPHLSPVRLTEARARALATLPQLALKLRGSEKAWFESLLQKPIPSPARASNLPHEIFNRDETEARTLTIRSQGIPSISNGTSLPSQTLFSDLTSLAEAIPAEIEGLLACPSEFAEDPFAQLVVSQTQQGIVIHVPAGVQVRVPLRGLIWMDSHSPQLFHRTLIVAEAGSEIAYIDEFTGDSSLDEDSPTQTAAGLTQIIAKSGARVTYYHVQNWPLNVRFSSRTSIQLERDAQIDCVSVNLGGAQGNSQTEIHCAGQGSSARVLAAARGDDSQKFNISVTTRHTVPDTSSAFDLLTVMADKSKAIFNGLIVITPEAIRTDAYQKNRNLILSPQASVETYPKLEIATDEVKCAHGASAAPVSFDQLYYLQSRGIPAIDAELMIINGFTDPVVQRFPEATGLRQRVMDALEIKHSVHPCGVTPTLQEALP